MIKKQSGKKRERLERSVDARKDRGFTLIEALVGITLLAVAVLGLAHLFLVAVLDNQKAGQISTATFLSQQQVESLRSLTGTELSTVAAATLADRDEALDLNSDGTNDFRRITDIQLSGDDYIVKVYVFSAEQFKVTDPAILIADPDQYRVKANMTTTISR
jgi:prepilin-type N-terminal cleavage/methylation domain-containing protein